MNARASFRKAAGCRRSAIAVALLLPFAAVALPKWSGESFFYGHSDDGAVKVPQFGDCPSYADNHTAEEREKVAKMGQLAADSYKDGTAEPPRGYTTVTDKAAFEALVGKNSGFELAPDGTIYRPSDPTGFNAVLYRGPDGGVVLAFRGTESASDAIADKEQIQGNLPTQYTDAAFLLGRVLENTREDGTHIDVTGHSLGGGQTQFAMGSNDLEGRVSGYTFNPAGLADENKDRLDRDRKIDAGNNLTNIRTDGDPVSYVGWHFGEIYDVEDHDGTFMDHSIGKIIGYDADGNAVYDGLLGSLAVANWNEAHPGEKIDDPAKLVVKTPDERIAELLRGAQFGSGGACPCGKDPALAERERKLREALKNARLSQISAKAKYDEAKWQFLADIFKSVPDACEAIAGYVAGDWGEVAIGWLNTAVKHYFGIEVTGDDIKKQLLGTVKAAAPGSEDLVNLTDIVTEPDDKAWWEKLIGGAIGFVGGVPKKLYGAFKSLKAAWDKVVEIGGQGAAITAAKYDLEDAEKQLLTAAKALEDFYRANAGKIGCTCAPGCACGCPCANCKPPEEEEPPEEGNPRPPSGGGSSQGGGAGDNYISAWIREARVGDAEDPWKPIHDGIVTEGAVSSGSKTLSDVIGYAEFSKILDESDELAKWNDAAGAYKDLAAGIWGAVTSGGSGAGTAIEKVLGQVIQWGNSWLDRFLERQSAKIGDWLMEKVGGIVEKLEALVEPWNRAMEKANASIRNWVAVSVEKWLETMKEYSDVMKEESRTDPLRGWMTVDYGYDGSVDVDAGAVPRTGNRRKNRYMETMGR